MFEIHEALNVIPGKLVSISILCCIGIVNFLEDLCIRVTFLYKSNIQHTWLKYCVSLLSLNCLFLLGFQRRGKSIYCFNTKRTTNNKNDNEKLDQMKLYHYIHGWESN